jgi:hypothetical protein
MKLNELFESEVKHIAFCFGRMNPPTIGHQQVLSTVSSVGGDYKIFVSQTQDKKKNPLDYPTKIKFLKLMFPKFAGSIVEDSSLNTIGKVCSHLYDQGYRHITLVAGSDRLEDMLKLIKDYNGIEGKAHGFYKFDTIDGKSSGDRDPDAEGISGVSASNARAAAANGNLEEFNKATGAGQYAEELYNAVRKGMGIKDVPAKEDAAGVGTITKQNTTKDVNKGTLRKMMKAYHLVDDINEAPIELDREDPMNPMIYGHDKANPAKLKYRMLRAAGQLKDLAARAENASPSEWQLMARQFEELKMNIEQIRHALEELSKIRSKGGIKSRGITV